MIRPVASTRSMPAVRPSRSEEHTSELQSRQYLVCRLLLEKKKTQRLEHGRGHLRHTPLARARYTHIHDCDATIVPHATHLPLRRVTFLVCFFFFFNDTATTEIYTLSLHDALPISVLGCEERSLSGVGIPAGGGFGGRRSEEHTSELQSRQYLVCRLLLEKKKK